MDRIITRSRRWLGLLALLLATGTAQAQPHSHGVHHSPYAPHAERALKALSDEDVHALMQGHGMGMAMAAELNGYPGPRHVLDMAETLQLTPEQQAQTQQIFDAMQTRATELGRQIVEGERALDAAFAAQSITVDLLEERMTELGNLRARLRQVHLEAHLELFPVLTEEQRAAYASARGYTEG